MNLYNLLKTIKDLSAFEMVNSAFIGDVYEVNARQDVEYPICVLTEGTHVGNTEEDTEIYSISLFLIDRLTEDKSNELDIKSWANEGVKDIISRIEETNVGLVQNGWQVNTFTQRFESLCAGAYATIQIETSDDNCCGDTIKMVTSINGKTGDVYIPGIEGDIVTSFNGQTGDVRYTPDLSDYYTKEQVDEKVIKASKVSSVNGQTGDVVIDIPTVPTNVSAFNNDAGYLTEHQDISNLATKDELNQKADKSEIPDVSIYNPTDNFKTINGESIIGTGNIHIEGGGGGDDKMDKNHPIFTENTEIDEINPDFRLSGSIFYNDYYGVMSYNCVERFHTSTNLWVNWEYNIINSYISENPATQYAAVKAFCRADGPDYGHCKYHLYIENQGTGASENIDQYMLDTHVYGTLAESSGISSSLNCAVDSRDPNDNISALISPEMYSKAAYYMRKSVVYYTPNSMYEANVAFNELLSYPYMTSLIDIKGILENYSVDEYTQLRVEIETDNIDHWHIMSTNLFFTNDTEFIRHSETHKEYVLIDTLDEKANKTDIPDVSIYNPTDNFKTINGESIIGTGDIVIGGGGSAVTSVNGQTGDVVIDIPVTSVNGATGDVTIDIPTVPTNVSAFINDADYVTSSQLTNYATKDELIDKDIYNAFVSNQENTNENVQNQVADLYNTKANKAEIPTVPTNVSAFTNDASYATQMYVDNATNSGNIVWTGTQAQYNALSDKSIYLIYLIKKDN